MFELALTVLGLAAAIVAVDSVAPSVAVIICNNFHRLADTRTALPLPDNFAEYRALATLPR